MKNSLLVLCALLTSTAQLRAQGDAAAKAEYQQSKSRAETYFGSKLPLNNPTGEHAIYGPDNRKDVVALPADNWQRKVAASTCILTNKSRVTKDGVNYKLTLEEYKQGAAGEIECCAGEAFKTQKTGGWCSGFLVGKNVVATAGHCTDATDAAVKNIAFVFGFATDASGNTPATLAEGNVYFGKKIIKHQLNTKGDFAIVELDRNVTAAGATPLTIADPAQNDEIVLIGYPSGLPCKVAGGAKVMEITGVAGPGGADIWLRTNCDAYGGNSGSAVFNSDQKVIGILVRGRSDFELQDTPGGGVCFKSKRYHDTEGDEILTSSKVFKSHIP